MEEDTRDAETGFLYSIASSGQYGRLVSYLGSNEPLAVRKKAADLLTQSLESLVEQDTNSLIDELHTAALTETNESVRANIIEVLIYLDGDPIDTLVSKIESNDYPTPTDAPHPLVYVEWLESRYVELRLVAVAGLGRVGTQRVVPKLITACKDHDKRIQIRAFEECGRIGDPRCVDPAIESLETNDSDITEAAARCLVKIGTDKSLTAIMPLTKESNLGLRRVIISELGTTGSLSVFGALLREISNPESQLKKTSIRSSIELIAHSKPEESHAVRTTVATSLRQFTDQDLIDTIYMVADSSNPQIRRNAIWVLCEIIDPSIHTESLDRLITAIADDDKITAKMTVSKLAKCKDSVIIDRIEEFIRTNELDSQVLQRADYIREQIKKKTADDQLKEAIEYTKVTDPADYTKKHSN